MFVKLFSTSHLQIYYDFFSDHIIFPSKDVYRKYQTCLSNKKQSILHFPIQFKRLSLFHKLIFDN
jgi:hypothetical protein